MTRHDRRSTSRRTFVKCGLVSTGTIVGVSNAGTSADAEEDPEQGREAGSEPAAVAERGVMFPYQFVPGSRFTVERRLESHTTRLGSEYRTHVIGYDHAPSFRALLFTGPDAFLEPERSFVLRDGRGLPETDRACVSVGIEAVEPATTDTR
ncbi:hypothetical protein [Halopiger djelfimassiliensis]|uniref:hypothetical protein n=1 Tax=Halopiger djelfimassiliensis TaxID=1293047 RepID=UPI0006776ED7|nr:hypothetical protein [Halopiger djelfimassiliensis]